MKIEKKSIYIDTILPIVLFIMALVLLLTSCLRSRQAVPAMPLHLTLQGEYSTDGENWKPLTENERFVGAGDELIIKGNLGLDMPGGFQLYLLANHIFMKVYVKGQEIYNDVYLYEEAINDMCGSRWNCVTFPELSADDEIEIYIYNAHGIDNTRAYHQLLDNLYAGNEYTMEIYLGKNSRIYHVAGIFFIVVSLILIGISMGTFIMHIPMKFRLGVLGISCFLMGGYFILDTPDLLLKDSLMVFNTYGMQICKMGAAFGMLVFLYDMMKTRMKKLAGVTLIIVGVADGLILLLPLMRKAIICQLEGKWLVLQFAVFWVLCFCCCYEEIKGESEFGKQWVFAAGIALSIAGIVDIIGEWICWQYAGICVKIVFTLGFFVSLVYGMVKVASGYRATIRVKRLERELEDSRIAIMMTQIQPHFLYNTLNSIYYLCKINAEAAQKAIKEFSDYLRMNLDSLNRTVPVSFEQELSHVMTYLDLEKLRFEDKMKVEYRILYTSFELPALSLQPIVENSVKHGLYPKEEGGTITISTEECESFYQVIITDNGVGFDPDHVSEDGRVHVGIENVRKRLKRMCHAELFIDSRPGEGTTVTINVPRNREDDKQK
ncbi:sensor histidine kinase [Sporofaciens sp. SGI.106]|uniref:sensor histidine kinase n=1 Tax=Sporofaciens sp. SGI.106 TaxID=3420568 RepID=UPI002A92461B|nr:histidine kinase [Lachnoclostridium sp.]